jgi:tetratricopeptide (TPR) repeat protein
MPPVYLSEGSPICIKPLINLEDSTNNTFGKKYSEKFKTAFTNPIIGKKAGVKMFNPWYTTEIYDLTENEADAKYVITGEYSSSSSSSTTSKEYITAETSSSNDPKIPFVFYEYTSTTAGSVNGKLTVFQSSSNQIVKEYPFEKSNSDSKSQYLKSIKSTSKSSLLKKSKDQAISQHILAFSPYFNVYTFNFENIKSDDKDYNKELRKQRKELKDYANAGQLEKLALVYIDMLTKDIKNTEDLHYNLGMCYEMLGNFTKAKEYYDKSTNSEAIKRINTLIQYRDIYETLGIEIIENDFI